MRAALVVLALVLSTSMVWAGETAAPAQSGASFAQGMKDFERNTALGAVLATRPGTPAELAETKVLADRGLKAAQELVAKDPNSAEAQYLLGSWLLYGYRVIEVQQISYDPAGGMRTETVSRAVMGLTNDPGEGLAALKRAADLAPNNGEYLLDYAAALGDTGQLDQARGVLKAIWAGQPAVSLEQKMRAGFLLSGVAEAEGDYGNAREWIYSALSLSPASAEAVERLRHLDAEETAAQEAAWAAEQAAPEEIEGEPQEPGADEGSYDEGYDQGYDDQSYDESYDEGSDQSYDESYDEGSDQSYDQSYDEGSSDQSYDDQSYDAGSDSGDSGSDGE